MFMHNGEKIKNLIKEYSERIREGGFKDIETELLYFLYECEVDSKNSKAPVAPNVSYRVKHVPSRRLI